MAMSAEPLFRSPPPSDEAPDPVAALSPAQVSAVALDIFALYFRLVRAVLRSSAEQQGSALEKELRYPRFMELRLLSLLNDGVHNLAFLVSSRTAYSFDTGESLSPPMLQDALRQELEWLYEICSETAYPDWWLTHRDQPIEFWRQLCSRLAFRLNREPAFGRVWRPAPRQRFDILRSALLGGK